MKARTPAKPRPDFPLFYHQTGGWSKKVRGKIPYFGKDPDAALGRWLDQRDDLLAGRTPRVHQDGLTIRELCNRFLIAKKNLQVAGELSPRTWGDYYTTCKQVVEAFGKTRLVADLSGDDFEKLRAKLARERGPVALGNEIQRVRTLLKFAFDENLSTARCGWAARSRNPPGRSSARRGTRRARRRSMPQASAS